ncbi:MAG: sigma-70 family RNA polymerase sigma factor [Hamadaea sp.]|uniref:sigma-70 family RNA polymerase sigma factor n=1 Tax=Hamadaea sp. TaxID=2024425 RepID=UPI001798BDA3|nr:sigma-70 family RNA polymerase sigma factor [Hamadaea sp.]NUT18636.1 sigma-70 family RNA polymerase sigma factor [Hamadaea sp.]
MDLSEEFSTHREHLRAVAYRILGSASDVDDALQEAWLRLARADGGDVRNARAWLTTVVARICLDMLRARATHAEVSLDAAMPADVPGPEQEVTLADTVGEALMVVLNKLSPAERLAFVLHDLFVVPFAEVAQILDRSIPATKMLASRARHRVRHPAPSDTDLAGRVRVVEAFLAASRNGDYQDLLDLLDPEVTARADATAAPNNVPVTVRGPDSVARHALAFSHQAAYAHIALIDGEPAIEVAPGGRLALILLLTVTADERILHIDIVADPQRLARLAPATDRRG